MPVFKPLRKLKIAVKTRKQRPFHAHWRSQLAVGGAGGDGVTRGDEGDESAPEQDFTVAIIHANGGLD